MRGLLFLLAAIAIGLVVAEGEHKPVLGQTGQEPQGVLQPPAAPRNTGYQEDPYYDYNSYAEQPYPSPQQASERQGEALIAAPLIVTAFSAALFGGLLSPAITYGFERMSEYEIKWPEFTRKTSSKSGSSRHLGGFTWLDTLETVGKLVRTLQAGDKHYGGVALDSFLES